MATIRCVGLSSDCRTNKWGVVCDCGKFFNPPTTMRSTQSFSCSKCGKEFIANYNDEPATITEVK